MPHRLRGHSGDFEPIASLYTKQNALSWGCDREPASESEARLAPYGFDQNTVTAEVFVQAREVLTMSIVSPTT